MVDTHEAEILSIVAKERTFTPGVTEKPDAFLSWSLQNYTGDGSIGTRLMNLAYNMHFRISDGADYSCLAARLWHIGNIMVLSDHGIKTFSDFIRFGRNHMHPRVPGKKMPRIHIEKTEIFEDKENEVVKFIDDLITPESTLNLDYKGLFVYEKSYLFRGMVPCPTTSTTQDSFLIETPQFMYMRVALEAVGAITKEKLPLIATMYSLIKTGSISPATPILYSALSPQPYLSSCFIGSCSNSIPGIGENFRDMMMCAAKAGGWGQDCNAMQSEGSLLVTGGAAGGIVNFIEPQDTAMKKCVDQGGRRAANGSPAACISHPDALALAAIRNASVMGQNRMNHNFPQIMIPDLFWEKCKEPNGMWCTFCPADIGFALGNMHGKEFNDHYHDLESKKMYKTRMLALEVLAKLVTNCLASGTPYLLDRDSCNDKNMQKNKGPIKASNLCAEMMMTTDFDFIAVCNLCSLGLANFLDRDPNGVVPPMFNFERFGKAVRLCVRMLNQFIDCQAYTSEKTRKSNLSMRPIGIGLQNLQGVFFEMKLEYDSPEAKKLASAIAECQYYHAIDESCDMAAEFGSYEYFEGSPYSKGILQPDLWGKKDGEAKPVYSGRYNFVPLREKAKKGIRNSVLIAHMPTSNSSTSNKGTPSIQPIKGFLYREKTTKGYIVVNNEGFEREIAKLGLDVKSILARVMANDGSIQNIEEIPQELRRVYRTAYEITPTASMYMAAAIAPFTCHSISLNQYWKGSAEKYAKLLMLGHTLGLKTLQYYCETFKSSKEDKLALPADISVRSLSTASAVSSVSSPESASSASNSRTPSPNVSDDDQEDPMDKVMICRRDNGNECTECSA